MKTFRFAFIRRAAWIVTALALLLSSACSSEDAIEQILGSGGQPPVFLGCKAVSADEVAFRFSVPVKVLHVNFDPAVKTASVNEGSTVTVGLDGNLGAGERVMANILVEDEKGNTLNVLVPFRTRNERLPPLLLTELRTEYSKPKVEYVEMRTLSAGNLGALRLFITGNTKKPLVYEFPPVEVANGEYILLHLRTPEEENTDETGPDLRLSRGADAVDGARDLWVPGMDKLLRKTDAVYLLDQDDRIVDAVMISETPDPWWKKEYFAQAAELLFSQGAWNGDGTIPRPENAVNSSEVGTAMTRSISRNEKAADTNTAADWQVTPKGGYSPGKPNN
jgi:hypothetical protein